MYNAFHRLRSLGRRRNFDKTIQKLLYAEIVRHAKNTGAKFPPTIRIVKRIVSISSISARVFGIIVANEINQLIVKIFKLNNSVMRCLLGV